MDKTQLHETINKSEWIKNKVLVFVERLIMG